MTLSEREQSAGPPARWVAIRPRTAVQRQVLVQVLAPPGGGRGRRRPALCPANAGLRDGRRRRR